MANRNELDLLYLLQQGCISEKIINSNIPRGISGIYCIKKNPFFGKKHSDETRQMIREQRIGIENYFGPVCTVSAANIITGEIRIFPSMAQAGRVLGVGSGHISSVCAGKLKQIGGWQFKKELV